MNKDFTKNLEETTLEKRKEIKKIISKAKINLFFSALKFVLGIFLTNFACNLIIIFLLTDVDPQNKVHFQMATMVINSMFMAVYFNGQIKKNNILLENKIKEILKRQD
jgi:cytochrome c biogenesis protein CcdA